MPAVKETAYERAIKDRPYEWLGYPAPSFLKGCTPGTLPNPSPQAAFCRLFSNVEVFYMPIQALYREAEAILRPQAGQLNIPLRLDEKRGQLLSALPRLLRARGLPFSCSPLPEESSFSSLKEAGGMLVFTIRPDWFRAQLEKLNQLPWGTVPEETGLRRNDRENEAFLLPYTVRRCRRQWEKGCSGGMDEAMVFQLVKGADAVELAKGYWRLSPEKRRDSLLAGAAGRIISLSFTKNSSTTHNVRYNVD